MQQPAASALQYSTALHTAHTVALADADAE